MRGDALVVGAAQMEAPLRDGEICEVGTSRGGRVDGLLMAAVEQCCERCCEVNHGGVWCLFEEQTVAQLFRSAAAEGEHDMALAQQRRQRG